MSFVTDRIVVSGASSLRLTSTIPLRFCGHRLWGGDKFADNWLQGTKKVEVWAEWTECPGTGWQRSAPKS